MLNEELYTIILFLESIDKRNHKNLTKYLDFYAKNGIMSTNIKSKNLITEFLSKLTDEKDYMYQIDKTELFISKLKLLLNNGKNGNNILKKNLDSLLYCSKTNKRCLKMIYTLWYLVTPLKSKTIKENRVSLRRSIKKIMSYFKTPSNSIENTNPEENMMIMNRFNREIEEFFNKYLFSKDKKTDSSKISSKTSSVKTDKNNIVTYNILLQHHNNKAKIKIKNN